MREIDTDYLVVGAGASGLAFVAMLGTIYQVATCYLVFNGRGRYGDDWPMWQKAAHA